MVLCGRFEGVDQRVIEARALEEVSLGDIVLSGGEPAALALLDACVRLLPGVIGASASLDEESFAGGLLEYPHYTRPKVWEGRPVPAVLLSGHHARDPGLAPRSRPSLPPGCAGRISGRAISPPVARTAAPASRPSGR